jgi:hypothetical protein
MALDPWNGYLFDSSHSWFALSSWTSTPRRVPASFLQTHYPRRDRSGPGAPRVEILYRRKASRLPVCGATFSISDFCYLHTILRSRVVLRAKRALAHLSALLFRKPAAWATTKILAPRWSVGLSASAKDHGFTPTSVDYFARLEDSAFRAWLGIGLIVSSESLSKST